MRGEVPHYAYLALIHFPSFPTEIALLCHHAETNDIFLSGGRAGPYPFTRMNKVEFFLVETLVLHIEFRLSSDFSSTMYLHWEQKVTENYHDIRYSLYVADVSFRDFIDIIRITTHGSSDERE